jgi:hypothetical protein
MTVDVKIAERYLVGLMPGTLRGEIATIATRVQLRHRPEAVGGVRAYRRADSRAVKAELTRLGSRWRCTRGLWAEK